MPKQGQTQAQAYKAMKQEQIREYLAKQGLVQQVVMDIKKMRSLDPDKMLTNEQLTHVKAANEYRMRLIAKYAPDLRAVEHTGEQITGLADMLRQLSDAKPNTPPSIPDTAPPQPAQAPKRLN